MTPGKEMKVKARKNEKNDKSPPRAETLTDLPVDAARQDEVTGGQTGKPGIGVYKSIDAGMTWV